MLRDRVHIAQPGLKAEAGLELLILLPPPDTGVTGGCYHAQLFCPFKHELDLLSRASCQVTGSHPLLRRCHLATPWCQSDLALHTAAQAVSLRHSCSVRKRWCLLVCMCASFGPMQGCVLGRLSRKRKTCCGVPERPLQGLGCICWSVNVCRMLLLSFLFPSSSLTGTEEMLLR